MNLDFLRGDALRHGLLVLRILTLALLTYTVLMDHTVTFAIFRDWSSAPIHTVLQVLGESIATLLFALLFGVRKTLLVIVIIFVIGVWDLQSLHVPVTPQNVLILIPQIRPLLIGIGISLAFSKLRSDYEQRQMDIEMRERNHRVEIIKRLHDGAAKKITQALIHIRTNPPADPEIVAFLDDALSELRQTMAATESLVDHRTGMDDDDVPETELVTIQALIDEYETVIADRNLLIEIKPSREAFPPLPTCTSELINNAVKYAKAGSTISIGLGEGNMDVVVQVSNLISPTTTKTRSSRIGLESTSRTFLKLGAQFTSFNDGERFTATVRLPASLTQKKPAHREKREILSNIFHHQSGS